VALVFCWFEVGKGMMVGIFFVGGDGERVCGMVTDGRVWKSTTALNIGRMLHTFMQRHFRGLGN
jgi:hypothetical protein